MEQIKSDNYLSVSLVFSRPNAISCVQTTSSKIGEWNEIDAQCFTMKCLEDHRRTPTGDLCSRHHFIRNEIIRIAINLIWLIFPIDSFDVKLNFSSREFLLAMLVDSC